MNSTAWWILAGYVTLFGGLFAATLWLRVKRTRERKPFPDHLRLRRGPGESLRRRIDRIDNVILNRALLAFLAPLAASAVLVWTVINLTGTSQRVVLGGTLITLVAFMLWIARQLTARLDEWRDRYLGYFGERVVAEALEPLKARGWSVFHDVPAGGKVKRLNLDHVVVGPGGVFAIETKTRRQGGGPARPGYAAHEIIYDGARLEFPWGEDQFGLDQAQERSQWLASWLQDELDLRVAVTPLLVFPGWTVVTRTPGPVTVLSPGHLVDTIAGPPADTLGPARVDAICRLLDARCRDVEF